MRHAIRKYETVTLVQLFKAGLTMQEIAERHTIPVLKIEQAIRRWMVVYPDGAPRKKPV